MARRVALDDLYDRYDGFLLDAFGVLNDGAGALPGARELVAELRRRGRPFLVVTNDASRRPETVAARLRGFELEIAPELVLTSGQLLGRWFDQHDLAGARCCVLGTDDSRSYVVDAGGQVRPIAADEEYDVLAVCDDEGYPFLDAVNAALSAVCRALDAGRDVRLVLPNPDLVFPSGGGGFAFTAGAIALLFEAALERRYPHRPPRFDRLGKPNPPLFEEAIRRLGTRRLLMIGDQLETDIAGARAAGLDAALVTSGVSRWSDGAQHAPTYLVSLSGAGGGGGP